MKEFSYIFSYYMNSYFLNNAISSIDIVMPHLVVLPQEQVEW